MMDAQGHHDHAVPFSPLAPIVALGGGVIAQVTPDTHIGAAGLVASFSALLVAGFQYYKAYLDAKQRDQRIEQLSKDLSTSRDRRHAEANRFNAVLLDLRAELEQEKVHRARLEGQLGVTDKSHAEAINVTAENTESIARQTGTKLSRPIPHVEPSLFTDSGDELSPFILPDPSPKGKP
jgi:hypothetical protein